MSPARHPQLKSSSPGRFTTSCSRCSFPCLLSSRMCRDHHAASAARDNDNDNHHSCSHLPAKKSADLPRGPECLGRGPTLFGEERSQVPLLRRLVSLRMKRACSCRKKGEKKRQASRLHQISRLTNRNDAQTEDGHAMMKSDTFHSLQDLSHAVRGCYNSALSLRVEQKRKTHRTAVNNCAPTSQLVCTRHQRPTGKWYVDCEGAMGGCKQSGFHKYWVMDLGWDSPGLCLQRVCPG